MYIYTINRKV